MGVLSALNAFFKRFRLRSFSSSGKSLGFPRGWGMAMAGIILLAPTVWEMVMMEQMWATGIPALSISFAIVAP